MGFCYTLARKVLQHYITAAERIALCCSLKHAEHFCMYIIFIIYWQMNLSFSVYISVTTGFSQSMIVESVSSSWIESYLPNKCGVSRVCHIISVSFLQIYVYFKQKAWHSIQWREGISQSSALEWNSTGQMELLVSLFLSDSKALPSKSCK